jgi:3D (Asp-Asp-Asp) domain-containing protein
MGLLLIPLLLILFMAGNAALCDPNSDAAVTEGTWDGPGSLGGVMGTGVSSAELSGARSHPLGGTTLTAGTYRSTAYAPVAGGVNCGNGCASTASGIRVDGGGRKAYLIASNPTLNKYGALAYIWPNPYEWRGPFVVADTGGDFGGAGRLDFYTFEPGSLSRALAWGSTKMVRVSSKPIVSGGPSDAGSDSTSTSSDTPEGGIADSGVSSTSSSKMVRPTSGPQTSPFGQRGGRPHQGVDLAPPAGTPIVAVLDGTVASLGVVSGYGNMTCLQHNPRLATCYAHQSRYANIKPGDKVTQGQTIGYVGSTGHSTGPHLHFEVRIGAGLSGTPVDPAPYLAGATEVAAAGTGTATGGQCADPNADVPQSGPAGERAAAIAVKYLGKNARAQSFTGFKPASFADAWCAWFLTNVWRMAGIDIPFSAWSGYPYQWAKASHPNLIFKAIGNPPKGKTPPIGSAIMYGSSDTDSDHINMVQRTLPDGSFMVVGGNQDGSRVTSYGPCRLSTESVAHLSGPGCDTRGIYGIVSPPGGQAPSDTDNTEQGSEAR